MIRSLHTETRIVYVHVQQDELGGVRASGKYAQQGVQFTLTMSEVVRPSVYDRVLRFLGRVELVWTLCA